MRHDHAVLLLACGVAVAAGAFYAMGGRVALTAKAALPCAIAATGLAVFYHLFWCMLGRESVGARCAGLRTMTFDGHRPSWQRRVARFVLACFSVSAVGIGVLWALVDDEGLTWHDHITKTFLTEFDPNPSSTRRQ